MKPFRALQFACSHLVAQPVGLPEQDVPRIQEESWERSRNRPEPTGFESSVTNFFPLPCPDRKNCLKSSKTFWLKRNKLREALLLMIQHRRLGPRNPADGIPSSEWPTVLKRVLEKKESLRNVADDSGVSPETIRRVVRAARCGYKASLRTDLPSSQHSFHTLS